MSLAGTLTYILNHPLNRDAKAAALLRFARWQWRSRMARGDQIVPFAGGAKLAVANGMSGATGNIYCGLDEFPSMAFTLHLLRPGDLFADVGANVGSYAMLAAEAGADCIAFEPNAAACVALTRNIQLNDFGGRVRVAPFCVGAAPGTVLMTTARGAANLVTTADDAAEKSEMAVVSLDGFLTVPATFAKIDVEGYEREVLAGAARMLADPRLLAVSIEMTRGELGVTKNREVCDVLQRNGFAAHDYEPFTRVLTPIDGISAELNTIFVRDAAAVRARLQAAPRYAVLGRSI